MDRLLLAVGLVLICLGLALRRRPEGGYTIQIGQYGWTILGNVTQTQHVPPSLTPLGKQSADRDWVGWAISGVGTVITILQVLKILG